ncbi:MAG: Ig-like domain-containing protein [Bacilli bacterium]|nr:Ig-like domain-containing protein [Bacilli bacterium]
MKKKFIFAMSAATALFLASCTGPAPSPATSTPADTGTSQQGEVDSVVSVTITGDSEVEVGKTITLVAEVEVTGEASRLVDWTASSEKATVNDAGVVTGVEEGEVTITATSVFDPTKKDEIVVTVTAPVKRGIKDITATGDYTIKGKVAAKNTKSFVLADEEASIMVYLNAEPDVSIGDYVEVKGAVETSKYSAGMFQFNSETEVTVLTGEAGPTLPEAVALDAEIVDAWVEASSYATTEMKLYKWSTTIGKEGGYFTLPVVGSDVLVEPVYLKNSDFPLIEGVTYDVEGYFAGYRVPSSGEGYAQIVLTKAEQQVGSVTIEASAENVTVGESITLTASIYGVDNGAVVWSFKEAEMGDLATLTPDAANPNVATLTGVAVGEVTVVASYEGKEAEISFEVLSAAAKDIPAEGLKIDPTTLAEAGFGSGTGSGYAKYNGEYKISGFTVETNQLMKVNNGTAFTADKTGLAYDLIQAQKAAGYLALKTKAAALDTLTVKMYSTYSTQAAKYTPTVTVDGETVETATAKSGDNWAGTKIADAEITTTYANRTSYPDGTTVSVSIYEYVFAYDLSTYTDAMVKIANADSGGSAMYLGEILFTAPAA